MTSLFNPVCRIDSLSPVFGFATVVDVLRLDLLHPVVSGNKWFKLKYYLDDAEKKGKKFILTFGGAYSNHIVATAAAAKCKGLKSIGVIRGQKAPALSYSLQDAVKLGMELFFISREAYKGKRIPDAISAAYPANEVYIVPEGGYGDHGMSGAKEILLKNDAAAYTHIISAVGTGTTLAGLAAAALPHQKIIGMSALKNNFSIVTEVNALLPAQKKSSFEILYHFHFGGYARYTDELLLFMNNLYSASRIPTDFVYTGKTFYGVFELLHRNYFAAGDKILLVHTGGLQGNRSLNDGVLIF